MINRGHAGGIALALALVAGAAAQTGHNTCVLAPLVGPGIYTGSTSAATTDGSASCVGSSRDVWFRYQNTGATAVGLTASTCGGTTNYDTVLSIHTSCGGTELACNDDSCGLQSNVSATVAASQIVWIRVAGFSSSSGNYTLTLTVGAPPPPPTAGPDVAVWNHTDIARQGTGTANGVAVAAFAIGTESCNRGDTPVAWYDFAPRQNEHPVIGQNIFRLKTLPGGYQRFDQIGQSWLKHGFASVNGNSCGSCVQPPGGGNELGVNCSDPYGSGLNGNPSLLGRRSLVNATTGFFPEPVVQGDSTGTAAIRGRCLVPTADTTSQPAGTRYFGETQYVTQDDAQHVAPGETIATNALNNNSWQEINAGTINSSPTFSGAIQRQSVAVQAWRNADPGVTLVTADHDDAANPGPGFPGTTIRSRYYVAAKATDLGGGQWRYEYVVYNQNSDRCVGRVAFAVADSSTVTGYTFNHPMSHSGEPYSNAPWTMTKVAGVLQFATEAFTVNANANAIRWGTMYSIGFTADVPPTTGSATLGLFKPGAAGSPTELVVGDLPIPTPPPVCAADFNGDGNLDPDDLSDYITCFFTQPCAGSDYNGDGNTDPDDLSDYITAFFTGC